MKAMVSSGKYPLMGKVEVDETVVGQQEEGVVGRQNNRKKQVVLAIESPLKNQKLIMIIFFQGGF